MGNEKLRSKYLTRVVTHEQSTGSATGFAGG